MARITRRTALAAAAGGVGYFLTAPAASAGRVHRANARLRVAGVGVGGKGSSDIDQANAAGMDVAAVCDVDADNLAAKTKKWPDAKGFADYRKIFDDAALMKGIDAFVVSTPDVHHALVSGLAIKAGKHVYTQKPLTRTVFEAHLLRKLAAKHGVCTQMGNQGTAENGLRRAVELIRAGTVGPIQEVHVWTNRPVWPQAPKVTARPEEVAVPSYLDWDCFLGPAPKRPYAHGPFKGKRGYYHDFNWRGWWDFGTGAIGDMACHTANMAFMALKLGHPTHVTAEAGDVNPETCPSYAKVVLKFPARGELPPVTLHWYEGQKGGKKVTPPDDLVKQVVNLDANPKRKGKLVDSGTILVGSKGVIYSPNDYGAEVFFGPEADFADLKKGKPETLPVNGGGDLGQKKEWVQAITDGKPAAALSNFEYASYLTAAFLLGNVAIRTGKGFAFDGETLACAGCPEAAQYIKSEYRKGWDLLGS